MTFTCLTDDALANELLRERVRDAQPADPRQCGAAT